MAKVVSIGGLRGLGLYPGDPCYDTGRSTGSKSLLPYWVDTDQEHACLITSGRAKPDFLDDWINSWIYLGAPDFPAGVYPAPGVPSGVLTDPSGYISQDDINTGNRAAHDVWKNRLRDLMREDPLMDRTNWIVYGLLGLTTIYLLVKARKK